MRRRRRSHEVGETFALPLELGRVLRNLGLAHSLCLEQRPHEDETFDVQQDPVDVALAGGLTAEGCGLGAHAATFTRQLTNSMNGP